MQRRFIFIVNPISGVKRGQPLQPQIEAFCKQEGLRFDIFPSEASGDYTFLKTFIAEHGVTDVVIAGGDGTINSVLNALRGQDVQFGILPCGSGNGLALSAGIPKNIDKALHVVAAGNSKWTDAFLINDRFACMLCGLGLDAQVAHDFANDPQRGLMTYVKKTVQDFFVAEAYPFGLRMEGNELDLEAFFISIANSNQFGNQFTIAPQASLTDGLLDIVIVTKQSKLNFLLQTIRHVVGFNHMQEISLIDKNASVIYFQTDTLSIANRGLAPLHLDGDPVGTFEQLEVSILKKCFRLISP